MGSRVIQNMHKGERCQEFEQNNSQVVYVFSIIVLRCKEIPKLEFILPKQCKLYKALKLHINNLLLIFSLTQYLKLSNGKWNLVG